MIRIGFVGAGKIAQALAKGFIAAGLTKGEKIVASDPFPQTIKNFEMLGAQISSDNRLVVEQSDVVFLAIKPETVPAVLCNIRPHICKRHLLLSTAMGVSIQDIEKALPPATRVIRVMPNTPVLVRNGASVFVCGSATQYEDEIITRRLLEAIGTCDKVPELLMDTITALSGSGPAYVYIIIEALADGAVKMGLPRDLAYRLAAQTVVGAGSMVLATKAHPAQLKDDVTSPAGSTAEGLHFLEQHGLRTALIGAIEAATLKCRQISKETKEHISNSCSTKQQLCIKSQDQADNFSAGKRVRN
ncbi:pyrroline-5-carboxylate reductase 3 isoform X1 [Zootermopsis nevadensis]|nr:pyrroline-5-carboxylate reductase 3 isoform X1 [Zootermopsis nevadensis]